VRSESRDSLTGELWLQTDRHGIMLGQKRRLVAARPLRVQQRGLRSSCGDNARGQIQSGFERFSRGVCFLIIFCVRARAIKSHNARYP
jgi:hypothetical protein